MSDNLIPVNTMGYMDEETQQWIPIDAIGLKSNNIRYTADNIREAFDKVAEDIKNVISTVDIGLNDIEELKKWIDKNLPTLIHDDVLKEITKFIDSSKLAELVTEWYRLENDFNFDEIEPVFYCNAGGYRNAVNQSLNIDDKTDHIFVSQADNENGFVITRLSPSGKKISSMTIVKGGHSTLIGLDRKTNGNIKLWFYHEGLRRVVQIDYKDNYSMSFEEAQSLTDFTPSFITQSCHVGYDKYKDNIFFLMGSKVFVSKRTDVREHKNVILYEQTLDSEDLSRLMQSVLTYDKWLYVQTGTSDIGEKMLITKYDLDSNQVVKKKYFDRIPNERGNYVFPDDFKEPEGLAYYIDNNGKHSLLFAITTGGHLKRHTNIYAISQRNGFEHFQSLINAGSQLYNLTRSDGRGFQVPDGTTSLYDLEHVGYYELPVAVLKNIMDFPDYPNAKKSGWKMFNSPFDQYYTQHQTLRRQTYNGNIIEFTRALNRHKGKVGRWALSQHYMSTQSEKLDASQLNNLLSNFRWARKFYITIPNVNAFTDLPLKDLGVYFENMIGDGDGNIRQFIKSNSKVQFFTMERTISKSGVVSDWVKFDLSRLIVPT
ncbi:DUF2497 domain-containing protein [Bacillus velezensis]|uniref:DUF2497 domain-containing protein n=1 Tax=Bacillus velezensis TaxID=492670 RepID=UPI001EF132C6|nr:DUF2497 domain-containing protein [Bacillus velezensis]MEC0388011.1 DUF2497 domain-containing protein [Bacillus velezensis]